MMTKPRIRASKRFVKELHEREAFLTDMLTNPDYAHLLERNGTQWEASLEEVHFQLRLVEGGMPDDQIREALDARRAFTGTPE